MVGLVGWSRWVTVARVEVDMEEEEALPTFRHARFGHGFEQTCVELSESDETRLYGDVTATDETPDQSHPTLPD